MSKKATKIVICSVLFQICWFSLVWSAGRTVTTAISVLCILLAVGQLYVFSRPLTLSLKYFVIGVSAGVVMDSILSYSGVHSPARVLLPWPIAPGWLIGLWAVFVAYTRTGLDGMRGRYILPAVAGVVCGPLAWLGGYKMGACEINSNPLAGYGMLSISWGLICVALFKLSDLMQVRDE